MILGASGSGKSGLALQLMAFGAGLVADDRTDLSRKGDTLLASCPETILGKIEARGLGILKAGHAPSCPVAAAVSLDEVETERLPTKRSMTLLGIDVPVFHKIATEHFAAALLQYLKAGAVNA